MKTQSQSLATFVEHTRTLHKRLAALVKRHPENDREPDDRIYDRLLTSNWRQFTYAGPMEARYMDASDWVAEFERYVSDLREFCIFGLNQPDKLNELPIHPDLQSGAAVCLHLLELQSQVLDRWNGEAVGAASVARIDQIRADLQVLVDLKGPKAVAAELRRSPDTVRDFLSKRTMPQEKTLSDFERYVNSCKSSD